MSLKGIPEFKILVWLAIIALAWHLLGIFGWVLSLFADVFLLLILSWILAFVLEPIVNFLTKKGLSRTAAAVLTYLAVAITAAILFWVILPTTLTQLTQLIANVPGFFPENSVWSTRIEGFVTNALGGSLNFVSGLASTLTGLLLIFIFSFYFLTSRKEISRFIFDIIPNDYKEEYRYLEGVVNNTLASFLQIQVLLGLIMGIITFVTMIILGIDLALSTSLLATILAMVPVIGPIIMLFPVLLATLSISVQKTLIAVGIIVLAGQLINNLISPKLLGNALKIHPIIVLLSFIIGYRLGGVWGAIFAVPITSALTIVGRELLKFWKEEADK